MATIDYAISLGLNCRTKHHLRRRFGSGAISGVFDWQVTPPPALVAALRSDFRGLFERADLFIHADERVVRNRRFGTSHQHQFPKGTTTETLDAAYERARKRHDHQCAQLRRVLKGRGKRLLFVISPTRAGLPDDAAAEIRSELFRLAAHHRPILLIEPPQGAVGDWAGDAAVWDNLLAPFTPSLAMRARSLAKAMRRAALALR